MAYTDSPLKRQDAPVTPVLLQTPAAALDFGRINGNGHRLKVLAVASGGGHWVQLRKLAAALDAHDVAYVTVNADYREEVPRGRFYVVEDASMWSKLKLLKLALQMLYVVLKERPDVILSTGAAPGYFALVWGKVLLRSRTAWVDSIANAEKLSSSGKQAGRFADLWLTQWEQLSSPDGPRFAGTIL
jgi:UDP-N-acetylglucosamine:LPS N-acetylglucosamine transferase